MRSICSRLAMLVLVVGPLIVAGCQRSAETTAEAPAKERTSVERPAVAKPSTDDDPAAAWQLVAHQVAHGEVEEIAGALPASYRDDLDRLLEVGVTPLDPEVRREATDAIAALALMLAEKEQLVIGSSRFDFGGPAAPFVRAHFAELCRVVAAVAKWPGWTAVEAAESGSLIQELARAIAVEPNLIESLKFVRFQDPAEQKSGSQQQILVNMPAMKRPRVVEVVRVEDRWLPKPLVGHWGELLGAERAAEIAADASGRENHLRRLAATLREMTHSLEDVTTQAEFDRLAERASTLLMASASESQAQPRRVESGEFVSVVVQGDLTDEQKDRLVWELASQADEPVSSLADATEQPDGEAFVIQVGPVRDLAAFAKRMQGLVVEEIDRSARKITARLAAP